MPWNKPDTAEYFVRIQPTIEPVTHKIGDFYIYRKIMLKKALNREAMVIPQVKFSNRKNSRLLTKEKFAVCACDGANRKLFSHVKH